MLLDPHLGINPCGGQHSRAKAAKALLIPVISGSNTQFPDYGWDSGKQLSHRRELGCKLTAYPEHSTMISV